MTASLINNKKHLTSMCKALDSVASNHPPQKTKTTKNQPQTNHFIVSSLNVLCILGLHIYTQSTYCLFYNFLIIWSNTFSFGVIENFMISYHFTMYTCFTTNIFLPQMFDTNTHMHIYLWRLFCYSALTHVTLSIFSLLQLPECWDFGHTHTPAFLEP